MHFSFFLFFFKTKLFYDLYLFLNQKWYFDSIINTHINRYLLSVFDFFFIKELDKGFIEILGPKGFIFIFSILVNNIKQKYVGRLYVYLVIILFNIFLFLGVINVYVIFL